MLVVELKFECSYLHTGVAKVCVLDVDGDLDASQSHPIVRLLTQGGNAKLEKVVALLGVEKGVEEIVESCFQAIQIGNSF